MRSRPRCTPRRAPAASLAAPLLLLLAHGGCTAPNPAFEGVALAPDAASPDLRAPVPDEAPDGAAAEDSAPSPDEGPRPVDLPPDLGPPGMALLVVGEVALSAGDLQLRNSLTRLGFTVLIKDGQVATAADATGTTLVVISGSAWSDDVGGKFRDVPVPVVAFDALVFGPMKLTGTKSGTDYGTLTGQRRLMIIDDTHPLAGGLSGLVTVSTADIEVSWGLPSSAAIKVATVEGQPSHYTIFGYPEGTTMVGMTAPARRVGAFVRFPANASYTDSGLLLFEASALWATRRLE